MNSRPAVDSPQATSGSGSTPTQTDTGEITGLLGEIDSLLASLESRSGQLGQLGALPFLGLARFELSSAAELAHRPRLDAPHSYEEGEARLYELLGRSLDLEPSLETSLRLLRARSLLCEYRTWTWRTSTPAEHCGSRRRLGARL